LTELHQAGEDNKVSFIVCLWFYVAYESYFFNPFPTETSDSFNIYPRG
jgi:hypothetical protein